MGRRYGGKAMGVLTATELSNLAQSTLGWVSGCAWTDVAIDLFPPTNWDPDPDARGYLVLVLNSAWALFLSVASVAYLTATSKKGQDAFYADQMDRGEVERSFLTGAMSFFVGWAWVVVIRAVCILAYRSKAGPLEGDGTAVVFLVVVLLTAAFFWAKSRSNQASVKRLTQVPEGGGGVRTGRADEEEMIA